MQESDNLEALWDKVIDEVKLRVIRPTLWRSLEIATPIAAENNEFVVGFPPGSYHMSGNLLTADNKNAIEAALQQFSGVRYSLRIIEGDSIDDWNHVKYKDQHLEALRDATREKAEREKAATQSWERLIEQIGRRYAKLPLRQLPQSRGRYIKEVLGIISETIDEIMPDGSPVDELAERSLARAIERVAQLTDAPASIIALELHRFRENRS